MTKKLLIDSTHAEEIRLAIVNNGKLEEFESETCTKKQIKGNIYLAKVIRVEPSLQAAFVEYGAGKNGFLPFSEIHPDYYYIPVSDRNAAKEDEAEVDLLQQDDLKDQEVEKEHSRLKNYRYKIQEVIKRKQIMLIQVVKEERGSKGASLTTFLSLAGRYCVLMPNAGRRTGGISRKISDGDDRKRLKDLVSDLNVQDGMSVIIRTAGQMRSKPEVKRDYEYLLKLWADIRQKALESIAPFLVYEEGSLIQRALRDIYQRDMEEILVEGDGAYKEAKSLMKAMIPSHAKKVKLYKQDTMPLFHQFKVEDQIDQMMMPKVMLPSGGSIVIAPTEALVAIDVNSGKSTRERHIDETALKTNLEAADEVARQMRLRDLSGLVVIDFIDMSDPKHVLQVEKRLKEATAFDRARLQIGRISQFGLLELSRQRLKPSLMETHSITCPHCQGSGMVRSVESTALYALRAIEEEALKEAAQSLKVSVAPGVDSYLLNQKRSSLVALEARFSISVIIERDDNLMGADISFTTLVTKQETLSTPTVKIIEIPAPVISEEKNEDQPLETKRPKKKKRKKPRTEELSLQIVPAQPQEETPVSEPESEIVSAPVEQEDQENDESAQPTKEQPRRRRHHLQRRNRFHKVKSEPTEQEVAQISSSVSTLVQEPVTEEQTAPKKKFKKTANSKKAITSTDTVESIQEGESPTTKASAQEAKKPKRRWWKRLIQANAAV